MVGVPHTYTERLFQSKGRYLYDIRTERGEGGSGKVKEVGDGPFDITDFDIMESDITE